MRGFWRMMVSGTPVIATRTLRKASPMHVMKVLLVWAIRVYQWAISPALLPRCRFYPSCSSYALEAVQRYGPSRGTLLAIRRLLRCHPFHPGGYDPVP